MVRKEEVKLPGSGVWVLEGKGVWLFEGNGVWWLEGMGVERSDSG